MRRRTIVTTTALFVCATTALTACSSSGSSTAKDSPAAKTPAAATPAAKKDPFGGRSGGQIFTDAMKADRMAPSLRLKANVTDAKDGPTKVDLTMNSKGDCTGTIGAGKDAVAMIKVGKTAYLRPTGTHKWIKSDTTTGQGKDLAPMCDVKTFLADQGEDNAAEKGPIITVGGVPAMVLTEKDSGSVYTLDVATTGTHYLLKMVTVGGDEPGTLEFSDFGRPVHAVAPPKSQIAAG
ncbi:hypothetical protein [Streptomyces sp. NBC_00083]|uniref:hypothetical protein n=1 Tax=Streptomyces sp. NBC_00083 TaxID=2975647 RepID=UPI00224D438D|nr:hypothetical protein [Streptomyces sp. NBC_00083]MCX5381997.1 hypothetical protein [Streptomyces sp. NBC_00083]